MIYKSLHRKLQNNTNAIKNRMNSRAPEAWRVSAQLVASIVLKIWWQVMKENIWRIPHLCTLRIGCSSSFLNNIVMSGRWWVVSDLEDSTRISSSQHNPYNYIINWMTYCSCLVLSRISTFMLNLSIQNGMTILLNHVKRLLTTLKK